MFILTDICDPKIGGERVNIDTPRIPETTRPHLAKGAIDVGVIDRNSVTAIWKRLNSQELSERVVEDVGVPLGIASRTSIAYGNQQAAVAEDLKVTPVVVSVWLIDRHDRDEVIGGKRAIGRSRYCSDNCVT